MNTLHCNDLGACEICNNCIEKRHPWYYCGNRSDNFGNISCPDDCEEFEEMDDDDDDTDDGTDHVEEMICPQCGADVYWTGNCYECEDCGWCGNA